MELHVAVFVGDGYEYWKFVAETGFDHLGVEVPKAEAEANMTGYASRDQFEVVGYTNMGALV